METYLTEAGKGTKIGVEIADRNLPLPPASLQRFLRSNKINKKIPGIVLADHEKEFNNKCVFITHTLSRFSSFYWKRGYAVVSLFHEFEAAL